MKRFTPEEDQYIRDNYLNMTGMELSANLNRYFSSIYGRMCRLGLTVPEEIKNERFRKVYRHLEESGKSYRFQKGLIPANKGKKMPPELYDKCKKTMFKPGNIPATCKHFGKPYLHTRKRKSGYIEKIWLIQESTNKRSAYLSYLCRINGIDLTGKIPLLKPGFDHIRTPTLDDIEIITYEENLKRNTFHRYPDELVRLIQVKGALQRQINKIKEK